jgi:hypothetical protein
MLTDERSISKLVERHFQFLFDLGFFFQFVKYYPQHMGNWIVILESTDCLVYFLQDRGYIFLAFGHNDNYAHDLNALLKNIQWFGLTALVYYLSKGRNYIGHFEGELREEEKQLERLARIAVAYIDEIIPIIGKDFEKHRSNLLAVNKQILELETLRARKKQS